MEIEKIPTFKNDPEEEIREAFDIVGVIVISKIKRLCNEHRYGEAEELADALSLIFSEDYNK